MSKLIDGLNLSGKDFEEFDKESTDLAKATKLVTEKGGDVIFLSLCRIPELQEEGKLSFFILTPETLEGVQNGEHLKVGRVAINAFGEELANEMAATTGLCAIIRDEKYLISDIALPTMTLRSGVKGDVTIHRQNLIRDMHLADGIFSKPKDNILFVYREEEVAEGVFAKKIFATMSKAYTYIPQTIVGDIAKTIMDEKTLGKASVREWEVNHLFTSLNLAFREAGEDISLAYKLPRECIPGVRISTSDVGKASVTVQGIVYAEGSYLITDEIEHKHAGEISPKEILNLAKKEIFDKVRLLPETLGRLIGRSVADYASVNLATEEGREKNLLEMQDCITLIMRDCFKGTLPQKRQDALLECLFSEVMSDIPYTLYDVASTFLSIPLRIEGDIDRKTLDDVRKACARVPYYLDEEYEKRKAKKRKGAAIALRPE